MGSVWDHRISVGSMLDTCGISVVSVWDLCVWEQLISVGSSVWNQCGISVVGSVWDQCGIIWLVWDQCGISVGSHTVASLWGNHCGIIAGSLWKNQLQEAQHP